MPTLTPDIPPEEVARALADARARTKGIEGWTLEQWHEAITRMRRLSAEHDLRLHVPDPNVLDLPGGSLGQIGYPTVTILEPRPALKEGDTFIGPNLVYPNRPDEYIPLRSIGELIPSESMPVMIISLAASDEHILAEVRRVLGERRDSKGLPRTTGAHSLSRSLRGDYARARWRNSHMVELVEMLAWKAVSGRKYNKRNIGFWIDPSRLGTSKDVSEAIALARQAIAALPEIMAEVEKIKL